MRGNAQGVEVSAAPRLFPAHRFADTAPHVDTRVDVDMRHTLGKTMRHFSGTNRKSGHHAQIPSP